MGLDAPQTKLCLTKNSAYRIKEPQILIFADLGSLKKFPAKFKS
jgi:hypothetical protein